MGATYNAGVANTLLRKGSIKARLQTAVVQFSSTQVLNSVIGFRVKTGVFRVRIRLRVRSGLGLGSGLELG